jgi:large subunit ribosomal protein L30
MTQLKVTQVKSAIGTKPKQRGTLRALGLRGIGQSNVIEDGPVLQGMLSRVPHLVNVAEVDAGAAD